MSCVVKLQEIRVELDDLKLNYDLYCQAGQMAAYIGLHYGVIGAWVPIVLNGNLTGSLVTAQVDIV